MNKTRTAVVLSLCLGLWLTGLAPEAAAQEAGETAAILVPYGSCPDGFQELRIPPPLYGTRWCHGIRPHSEYFLGEIVDSFNRECPSPLFPADGRRLSLRDHNALYAVIGGHFG